jgi:hypothetical protein
MGDDPLAQAKQMIADARQDFAADVDALLIELRRFSDSLGHAIGEVSREEALRALRQFVLEKFDQRLPMRNLEAALLRQLVREAADLLANPETHVNLRDWQKSAEPFLRG